MDRRLVIIQFCIFLLISSAGLQAAPARRTQKAPPITGEEAAAGRLAREMGAAVLSKDADQVMRLYVHSDDLVVFDPGPKFEYKNWEDYRAEWKRFFSSIKSLEYAQFLPAHTRISGSLGYFTGRWRMKFVNSAGEDVALEGRMTEIIEKSEGKWRIVHEHTSLPISEGDAGPPPDPAAQPAVQYFLAGLEGDGASGIQGEANVSPIHGGPERIGEKNSRPLPDSLITIQRAGGSLTLAQQRTDANGRFRISLKPGKYLIVGLPPQAGAPYPRGSSKVVEVRDHEFTRLTVGYDSGLR